MLQRPHADEVNVQVWKHTQTDIHTDRHIHRHTDNITRSRDTEICVYIYLGGALFWDKVQGGMDVKVA